MSGFVASPARGAKRGGAPARPCSITAAGKTGSCRAVAEGSIAFARGAPPKHAPSQADVLAKGCRDKYPPGLDGVLKQCVFVCTWLALTAALCGGHCYERPAALSSTRAVAWPRVGEDLRCMMGARCQRSNRRKSSVARARQVAVSCSICSFRRSPAWNSWLHEFNTSTARPEPRCVSKIAQPRSLRDPISAFGVSGGEHIFVFLPFWTVSSQGCPYIARLVHQFLI